MGLYNGFLKAAKDAGLEVRQDHLRGVPNPNYGLLESDFPRFGFDSFNRMWDSLTPEDRPDGMFIYPDAIAPGALMALAMRNVRVPEDLKLVIHNNEEVPVFCPYPVDRLVVKVSDAAQALVNHIRDRLVNRPSGTRLLPARMEKSD
jgi:DNA-binding LacI/PurR family transcriptional regulator